ncbi:MAG: endo-1,4-beta-xylanase, partial [Ktedonobacteraceae bacterium]|nr:endo-1,4-beta-xylanase [Ktedonobacteraceae bacterium]
MFHRHMRKGFLVVTLALLLTALVYSMFLPQATAASTIGAAAAAQGRTFGAAVANSHLGEAQYASTLDTEFTGVTPENEMKWDATEPSRGSFSFGAADAIVSHAQSHNMKIRGHTLVWHSQLPGWVSGITSGTELLQVMKDHIAGVMGHFKGKITYWDVVNEAFDGGSRRNSIFQQLIGNSYIEEAFKAARAADPAAKLCYNDFSTDGVNSKSTAILNMVLDFKSRGIPIDCVGFQAHLIVGQVPSDFQSNLQRFADAGVDVNITELDIRMPTPASSANLQQQATDYQKVVSACLAVSRCTSITTWGITDKYSWVPGTFSGQGAALLFDENYNKKPAYNSVLQALGGTNVTPTPTVPVTPTATNTPTPTPTQGPGGSCRVHYAVTNQWPGGFSASLTITNTGSTT